MASTRYMERRKKGGKWLPAATRLAIYLRDDFTCQYCGRYMKHAAPRDLTLDHLVCHEDGGLDVPSNLVSCCKSCNSKKGRTKWTTYAPGGAIRRIRNTVRRVLNMDLAKAIIKGTAGR
jgi:5-methylcytosine-specific restriction endonuclease McrA